MKIKLKKKYRTVSSSGAWPPFGNPRCGVGCPSCKN